MTTEGWIFMVGFRVFDVGALIVWLVWFFRLRDADDDDSSDGDDFRRDGDREPEDPTPPTGPPGLELPKPDAEPWPYRRRDHVREPARTPARPARAPHPVPARGEPLRRETGLADGARATCGVGRGFQARRTLNHREPRAHRS